MDTAETIAATYLQRHASIDIGNARSRGWTLLRDNMAVLVVRAAGLARLDRVGLRSRPRVVLGWIVGFVLLGGMDYMIVVASAASRFRSATCSTASISPSSTSPWRGS